MCSPDEDLINLVSNVSASQRDAEAAENRGEAAAVKRGFITGELAGAFGFFFDQESGRGYGVRVRRRRGRTRFRASCLTPIVQKSRMPLSFGRRTHFSRPPAIRPSTNSLTALLASSILSERYNSPRCLL
jgi:hypothetical protein